MASRQNLDAKETDHLPFLHDSHQSLLGGHLRTIPSLKSMDYGRVSGVRIVDGVIMRPAKASMLLYKLRALEFLRNCGDLGSKG